MAFLYKRAPVLEQFYAEGVIPDHVAALLKERGGVDFIYDQLCASKKICREVIAVEDEGHEPDAPINEALPVKTIENSSGDETSEAAELQADGSRAQRKFAVGRPGLTPGAALAANAARTTR